MQYAEYPLIDNGYDDPSTEPRENLPDISGRDNRVHLFVHNGYSGYPSGAVAFYDAPDKTKTLALFQGAVADGGVEIPVPDVTTLLISDYGWPEGTALDAEGLPQPPAGVE